MVTPKAKLQIGHRRTRTSPRGRHAWGFGISIGYWPCYTSPYLKIDWFTHKVAVWYGAESYRDDL
jgi:hypothetical protein